MAIEQREEQNAKELHILDYLAGDQPAYHRYQSLQQAHVDFLNYCALKLLRALGNDLPSQQEVDFAEEMLSQYSKPALAKLFVRLVGNVNAQPAMAQ